MPMTLERRAFGRTGHMSSAVIFGAAALGKVDQGTADRVLDLLLRHGVNHIDVAASYGDAELRVGPWMARHRKDFFLATKTGQRDRAAARDEIHRSLERLRTDRVDLLQLHALIHPDEWDRALGEGGALEAAVEAREQGLVRFIGVTGHGWNVAAMHRRSLERFDFDSILLPWNWVCAEHRTYRPDFEAVVALCQERNVAVQTIKAIARGPWAAGAARDRSTWYQPLEDEADIETAVRWVLGRPGIFLNSVGDVALLPAVLRAAERDGDRPPDALMAQLRGRAGLSSIFGL
jgi:aryl-alcohol dehydrogenase-like predicted oxidoreductase